jgi:hypothetical protein
MIYLVTLETLDDMLKAAAEADGWTRVVRRCAWCRRAIDAQGEHLNLALLKADTVITDGMCAACGTQALATLASRRALAA